MAEPEGGERGHLPPLTPPKFPCTGTLSLTHEKERKNDSNWLYLTVILMQEKESKNKKKTKILKHQIISLFHCSTVLISFCLVPHLTPILQYFSFLISIIIFTINDNFCSILLLNDVRDITNFTIYIL